MLQVKLFQRPIKKIAAYVRPRAIARLIPVADRRLNDRHGRNRRRIGPQDPRPERDGGDEIEAAQPRALLLGKTALGADQQRQLALADLRRAAAAGSALRRPRRNR